MSRGDTEFFAEAATEITYIVKAQSFSAFADRKPKITKQQLGALHTYPDAILLRGLPSTFPENVVEPISAHVALGGTGIPINVTAYVRMYFIQYAE